MTAQHPDRKLLMFCSAQLTGGSIDKPYFADMVTRSG